MYFMSQSEQACGANFVRVLYWVGRVVLLYLSSGLSKDVTRAGGLFVAVSAVLYFTVFYGTLMYQSKFVAVVSIHIVLPPKS